LLRVDRFERVADALRGLQQIPDQPVVIGGVVALSREHQAEAAGDTAVAAKQRHSQPDLAEVELAEADGVAALADRLHLLDEAREAAAAMLAVQALEARARQEGEDRLRRRAAEEGHRPAAVEADLERLRARLVMDGDDALAVDAHLRDAAAALSRELAHRYAARGEQRIVPPDQPVELDDAWPECVAVRRAYQQARGHQLAH